MDVKYVFVCAQHICISCDSWGNADCGVKTRLATGVMEGELSTDEGGIEYEQGKSDSLMGEIGNNKGCGT